MNPDHLNGIAKGALEGRNQRPRLATANANRQRRGGSC